jgi:hypothetical protein
MTEDNGESGRSQPGRQQAPVNKKAALSAALRANLQKRKARERALRAGAATQEPGAPSGDDCDSEAKWTK